jgi:hypothetical protein
MLRNLRYGDVHFLNAISSDSSLWFALPFISMGPKIIYFYGQGVAQRDTGALTVLAAAQVTPATAKRSGDWTKRKRSRIHAR